MLIMLLENIINIIHMYIKFSKYLYSHLLFHKHFALLAKELSLFR